MSQSLLSPAGKANDIAVIIPTYNRAGCLPRALHSVLRQSLPAREIIVVDDGSTDGTGARIREFPQVRYYPKANGGVSSARNLGIRHAGSPYVLFLDSDDELAEGALESLSLAMAQTQGRAAAVFGACLILSDGQKSPAGERYPPREPIRSSCEQELSPALLLLSEGFGLHLLEGNLVFASSTLVERECVLQAGLFDESLRLAEDQDLWLRVSCRKPLAYLDQVVMHYHKHEDNLSRPDQWWPMCQHVMRVQEKCMRGDWAPAWLRRAARRQFAVTAGNVAARCAEAGQLSRAVSLLAQSCRTSPLHGKNWARLLAYAGKACLTRGAARA